MENWLEEAIFLGFFRSS